MIYRQKISCLSLFFLLYCGAVFGQEKVSNDLQEAYRSFDSTVGIQNTDVFTGVEYIEKHRMINEKHKFFGPDQFAPSTVFYDGQPYFNISAKYNVFDDLLLVNLPSQRGETDFKLLPNKLEGFILHSVPFVNVYREGSGFSGIYQLLFESGKLRLLKKHRRIEQKVSGRELVHYEFKTKSPHYYFQHRDELYELSRKNLLSLFPDQKQEIRELYRKYRKQKKEQRDEALIALFTALSDLPNHPAQ